MATCFDQLQGHPQATRKHKKIKITIASFILGQNKILELLLQNEHQQILKFVLNYFNLLMNESIKK